MKGFSGIAFAVVGLAPAWLVACERLREKAPIALAIVLVFPWLFLATAFRAKLAPGIATTARLAAALLAVDVAIDLVHPYPNLFVHVPWEIARVVVVFGAGVLAPRTIGARYVRGIGYAFSALLACAMTHLAIDGSRDETRAVDAALVLGFALDPEGRAQESLVARVDRAAALVKDGHAPLVVASGGAARAGKTEASVIRDLLLERGVAPEMVVLDEASRSTIENFACSSPVLRTRDASRVLLVTEPWHLTRASLLARRHAPSLAFFRAPASSATWRDPRRGPYWLFRDTNGWAQEIIHPQAWPAPCPMR